MAEATQILAHVEEDWLRKIRSVLLDLEGETTHQICSFMWAENFGIMSSLRDLIEEASRWDLVPKPASLWWTSTYDSEEKVDMNLGTSLGCYKLSSKASRSWAFWKDILIHQSTDVTCKVKCQRLYAVFSFGNADVGEGQRMGNQDNVTLVPIHKTQRRNMGRPPYKNV